MHTVDVEFIGDTAIEHGEYTLELAAGKDKGKFIVVWKRQNDGTWKWHVDIFNSDLPPA
jgi:ketosteroid isomerase-like protein